jgi:hypothetical protein
MVGVDVFDPGDGWRMGGVEDQTIRVVCRGLVGVWRGILGIP